jgi:hypothetical protein
MLKIAMAAAMTCAAIHAQGADHAGRLYAGAAKVDITPDQAVFSANGESFRLPDQIAPSDRTPPNNIHDPLNARVVVLKNKDVSLAIVSVDLILFSSRRVVAEAKRKWRVDHVILSCTHTHTGVVPRGMCPTRGEWGWTFAQADPGETLDWPAFSEDPWYAATEEKIIAAIGEASQNLFPARVAVGTGRYESAYMAHNRRLIKPDGTVTMMWANPHRLPTQPIDPTLGVIRIDDQAGKPRVLMVHYACHPVMVMGAGKVSRDFPGAMVDYVEQELGASCMAVFLQGAQGDLDPYECGLRGDYGFHMVRQAGTALGKAALRLMDELAAAKAEASLRVKENLVTIPHRIGSKTSQACVMTAMIGNELALVTIPGEPFIQHQLNLRNKSPVPNTFLLGIAYCGQGSPYLVYIPTAQAVKEGGYGASECSFVSGEAGDLMVNAAAAAIAELARK